MVDLYRLLVHPEMTLKYYKLRDSEQQVLRTHLQEQTFSNAILKSYWLNTAFYTMNVIWRCPIPAQKLMKH